MNLCGSVVFEWFLSPSVACDGTYRCSQINLILTSGGLFALSNSYLKILLYEAEVTLLSRTRQVTHLRSNKIFC